MYDLKTHIHTNKHYMFYTNSSETIREHQIEQTYLDFYMEFLAILSLGDLSYYIVRLYDYEKQTFCTFIPNAALTRCQHIAQHRF